MHLTHKLIGSVPCVIVEIPGTSGCDQVPELFSAHRTAALLEYRAQLIQFVHLVPENRSDSSSLLRTSFETFTGICSKRL